ncbi:hypothetical protein Tco_0963703 [Tanacetum coccineum]
MVQVVSAKEERDEISSSTLDQPRDKKKEICDKLIYEGRYMVGCPGLPPVTVIPPDHVDDVPIVKPNQHDDVPTVPDPVLGDEDEDLEEDKFEEEEDPQEEDDMEVDIEEDENEPELTSPYEEVDPLNPSSPASESEPKDAIEVENPIEHGDEIVSASVHEIGESFIALFHHEDSDGLLLGLMRRDINSLFGQMVSLSRRLCGKLILDLGNEVRSSIEQGTAVIEKLVEKLGNAKDKVECKKLKKELEESRFSNTFLRMQNERVDRDLYWTRVRAHEFYQEMICKGFLFEERTNAAINVPIKDEKSPSSEPRGYPHDSIMPPKHENVGNDAKGSGPTRGQDAAPTARECTFAGFMKCNPTAFRGTEWAVKLLRWFKKTKSVFGISDCVKDKKVRFAATTLQGPALTWWNSKIVTMGLETVNQVP